MNRLLIKRLRRSLMRTKLRVITVVLLITIAVYSGVVFSEHGENADVVYEDFYTKTNFADLVINFDEPDSKTNISSHCDAINQIQCETRLMLDGQTHFTYNNGSIRWLQSLWHGIDEGDISTLFKIEGSVNPGLGEIVIDAHFAKNSTVLIEVGDNLTIGAGAGMHTLKVVGIANHPLQLWYAPEGNLFPLDSSYVVGYLSAEQLALVGDLDVDSRNTLYVDLEGTPAFDFSDTDIDEGKNLNPIKSALSDSVNQSGKSGLVADRGDMNGVELLRIDLEGAKKSTPFILGVLLFVSGLVIAISLDRLIKTQAREIAVMRTIGATGKDIMSGYLMIPLVLGLPGVIFGILLGLSPIGSEAFTEFYFGFMGVPVTVLHHYPIILFKLGISALIIIFLFGIRPALRASKMQPLDVFGQGSSTTPNKIIANLTSAMPPVIGLALRSTFRKPARLMVTLVALSLAMVILGGMMLMMAGFTSTFNEAVDEQVNWDYQLYMLPSRVDEVELWAQENTTSFELTLDSSAIITGTTKSFTLRGLDILSSNDDSMYRINLLEGDLPTASRTPIQVIIDEGMAEMQGYSVGDKIAIDHFGESVEVEVSGIAREMTRTMLLHRADLSTLAGIEATGAMVILSEQGQIESVRGSTIMVIEKSAMVKGFHDILDQQQAMMQSTYVIGGLMAVAILFNTLLINLSERDSELATLRVLGASRSRLALILTVEHAFIGLIGGLAGILASAAMYKGMANAFSTWLFHMPVIIDTGVALQVVGFVFIAALLTTPVGIWRIGRMDLLDVISRHER